MKKIKCRECLSILRPRGWINPDNTVEPDMRTIECPVCGNEFTIRREGSTVMPKYSGQDVELVWTLYHHITETQRVEIQSHG